MYFCNLIFTILYTCLTHKSNHFQETSSPQVPAPPPAPPLPPAGIEPQKKKALNTPSHKVRTVAVVNYEITSLTPRY